MTDSFEDLWRRLRAEHEKETAQLKADLATACASQLPGVPERPCSAPVSAHRPASRGLVRGISGGLTPAQACELVRDIAGDDPVASTAAAKKSFGGAPVPALLATLAHAPASPCKPLVAIVPEDNGGTLVPTDFLAPTHSQSGRAKAGEPTKPTSKGQRKLNLFRRWHMSKGERKLNPFRSQTLELAIAVSIVVNAVTIGWEVQFRSLHNGLDATDSMQVLNWFFAVLFTLDLVVRIYDARLRFLPCDDRRALFWNLFDSIVVASMWVDRVASNAGFRSLSAFRTLRLLRVLRVVRVLFVLKELREFHVMIASLYAGTKTLVYTLVVLMMVIYVTAIMMTEGVMEHCHSAGHAGLCDDFGTLDQAFFSLFMVVLGGRQTDLAVELRRFDSFLLVVFVAFVAFSLLVIMNSVTALFVLVGQDIVASERKKTLVEDMKAEEQESVDMLCKIFQDLDVNGSGDITFHELKSTLENPNRGPELVAWLQSCELGNNPLVLFDLLDHDLNGAITVKEFVTGCMSLRGQAKTMELMSMQKDILRLVEGFEALEKKLSGTPPAPEMETGDGAPAVHRRSIKRKGPADVHCAIPETENRAMTLLELLNLRDLVLQSCAAEQWVDERTGKLLRPEEVNLYSLTYNHVAPATIPGGVLLHGLGPGPFAEGQAIVQKDRGSSNYMPVAEGVVAEASADGAAVRVRVSRGRFVLPGPGQDAPVFVDGVECAAPSKVESPGGLSYKELVSSGPAAPKWYCCHWWGESVLDFIACCEEHAKLHDLSPDAATFWVCGYANCQHNLANEICDDPDKSSFRRAMRLADGVLLILDPDAVAFTRIWCDFELYKTICDADKKLDVITIANGRPHLITEEPAPNESLYCKSWREREFPIALFVAGLRCRLEDGQSSVAADKDHILEVIARDGGEGGYAGALKSALSVANAKLHAHIALAAWPQAIRRGIVDSFGQGGGEMLRLPDILAQDKCRTDISLSLAHSDQETNNVHDEDVIKLAQGLPRESLVRLHVSLEGCVHVSNAGISELVGSLPPCLQELSLDLSSCSQLADRGIEELARRLPQGLERLDLCLAGCGQQVTSAGALALARHAPKSLKQFSALMLNTGVDRNFESLKELKSFSSTPFLPALEWAL